MNTQLESAKDAKKRLNDLIQKGQSQPQIQLEPISIKGYEQVLKVTEKKSGLKAIIAIHNTTLGPALGGIRIHPYATFDAALEDVLRLSKGMTYKSAVSDVGFGGGKIVIIADPKTEKTPELLYAMGAAINQLNGKYIAAEDMGCTTADCQIIRQATQYIVGLAHKKSSGDPSPFTAYGVFCGVQSAAKKLFGSESLENRVVAVQGLGSVGAKLADLLFWAGAQLILSDIDLGRLETIAAKYQAKTVAPDQILSVECDILSPCAMGAVVNDQTLPYFHCKAIAGAANNQLHRDMHAKELQKQKILYAPDFVINSAGLLNVAAELEKDGYHPALSRAKARRIYDSLLTIYEIAEKNNDSTHAAALALGDYRIKYGIGKRLNPPTFHHTID